MGFVVKIGLGTGIWAKKKIWAGKRDFFRTSLPKGFSHTYTFSLYLHLKISALKKKYNKPTKQKEKTNKKKNYSKNQALYSSEI